MSKIKNQDLVRIIGILGTGLCLGSAPLIAMELEENKDITLPVKYRSDHDVGMENYRKLIKKDMKIRNRIVYSYYTEKAGDYSVKYVMPALLKTSAGISFFSFLDPSGGTAIAGAAVGAAAIGTGAGGFLIKHVGGNIKDYYCKKIYTDPSTLNLKEEKALIRKEKKLLKAIKNSTKLQDKISKEDNKEKESRYYYNKITIDKEILMLKNGLDNESKLDHLIIK